MSSSSSRMRVLAATVCVLALGACATVGPDFHAPDAPKGAAASGYAMAGDPSPGGVSLSPDARMAGPWWQAFGSPELDQAVRRALADSPSVAEALATLQKAQAEADATRGEQSPQVGVNADVQRERINTQKFGFNFPSPTVNLFTVGGAVSYDLDLFGGRRRATEADKARAEAEARRADAAYLALSGNVALEAVKIAGLRSQIAAMQDIIASDMRIIDMVRKAQAAGGLPRSALSLRVAHLAEDQALLPPLQRALTESRHRLAFLSGRSPADYAVPDFELAALTVPADVPVSLPSELVRQRPDILAAEAELHAATADIGVAVANQYPNIRLSAGLTQDSITTQGLFNHSASGWSLLAGVTAPVFDGGTLKARRRAAEAEARAAMARYEQTVLRAFVQVSDVLAALATDQATIASLTSVNATARDVLGDARAAYRLGGGPLIDVVQAESALNRARRTLITAQGQRLADLVALYAATATDWRVVPGA